MMNQNEFLSDKAAEQIAKMSFGTVIQHDVLLSLLECHVKNGTYRLRLQKTREKLIVKHHRFLKTIPRVGYEISQPGQEIKLVSREFLQGISKMGRSVVKSTYIDIGAIPKHDQTKTISEIQRISTVFGLVTNSIPTMGTSIIKSDIRILNR